MRQVFLSLLGLLFWSCAEEFVPDNPIDPDNPDYIPPIVSITDGLEFGQVITQENFTVSYSGNESPLLEPNLIAIYGADG